jgi:hypothetical protein
MGGCCSAMAGKDQYQTPLTPSLTLRNTQIKFGASQGLGQREPYAGRLA